jgi:hypothetical protein
MNEFDYQEVKAICENCGREVRVIAYKDTDLTEYLCPKCCSGDAYFEEESDI